MNRGLCNQCKKLVEAVVTQRDSKVYLVKDCPDCGKTETLISSDAGRYYNKHEIDGKYEYAHCELTCTSCKHKDPNMVFIDITNHCNMNCPICINNTPTMGFDFEPPLSYFEIIFDALARLNPKPVVQLFGGEPTVHRKLFEIIKMARSRGLRVRIVTNGLKLADEDYCRRLIQTRSTILIAYDNDNPELYKILRGNERVLDIKRKAFANIDKIGGAKVGIMSMVAKGFNDKELLKLFAFCHDHRTNVRGVYLMPLAHTWVDHRFGDFEPERITPEDLELAVAQAYPRDPIDFIPAGFLGQLPNFLKYMRARSIPFMGSHPNCESFYLLLSDGKEFHPIGRYLKRSTKDVCQDLLASDGRLGAVRERLNAGFPGRLLDLVGLKRAYLFMALIFTVIGLARRNFRIERLVQGGSAAARLWNMIKFGAGVMLGKKSNALMNSCTNVRGMLQIIVLPFEDKQNLETERLERCPAAFAFVDPADMRAKWVPVCAWGQWKVPMMKKIMEHYQAHPETLAAPGNGNDCAPSACAACQSSCPK